VREVLKESTSLALKGLPDELPEDWSSVVEYCGADALNNILADSEERLCAMMKEDSGDDESE
jgi:hypothetical protein